MHKFSLKVRCLYGHAKLWNLDRRNKSHLIILDFEPTAVKGMLHFAYTGELSNDIQDHLA